MGAEREPSNEYQNNILVLWTKVVSALEGLSILVHTAGAVEAADDDGQGCAPWITYTA